MGIILNENLFIQFFLVVYFKNVSSFFELHLAREEFLGKGG